MFEQTKREYTFIGYDPCVVDCIPVVCTTVTWDTRTCDEKGLYNINYVKKWDEKLRTQELFSYIAITLNFILNLVREYIWQ